MKKANSISLSDVKTYYVLNSEVKTYAKSAKKPIIKLQ